MKKTSRRALMGRGVIAGAAVPLAACAGIGPADAPAATQREPANLTFATFQLPPALAGVAVDKALREYEARNPGTTVKLEALTNSQSQDLAKIQTLLAGGTPPDLALSRHHHLGYLASRSAFVAVEPLLQKDKRATRNDFFPVVADRLTWGGKMWGLPQDLQITLSYYNLDLYAAANERPPDGTWTWDRFMEASRRLANAGAFNAPPFWGGDSTFWEIGVWAFGGDILNSGGNECVLNRPPAPEGLQFRADLLNRSGIRPSGAEMGGLESQAFFAAGRLGNFNGSNSALMDVDKNAAFKWTVQPLPAGRAGPWTLGAGPNYVLFQAGKLQDAAWAVIADLVTGGGQKTVLANSTLFPGLRSMAKAELLPSYKPEWIAATLKGAEKAKHPHYNHANWPEIDAVCREQLAPLWNGQQPAQVVADEVARQVTPIVRGQATGAPRTAP